MNTEIEESPASQVLRLVLRLCEGCVKALLRLCEGCVNTEIEESPAYEAWSQLAEHLRGNEVQF